MVAILEHMTALSDPVRCRMLMLLDREADIFLARRAESDGWMIKPLDAFRLRRAVQTILESGSYTEGVPAAVPATP